MAAGDELDRNGSCRVAAVVPLVALSDPAINAASVVELAGRAEADGVDVVVFPELNLSGYSNDDLFQQRVLDGVDAALRSVLDASAEWPCVVIVGMPRPQSPHTVDVPTTRTRSCGGCASSSTASSAPASPSGPPCRTDRRSAAVDRSHRVEIGEPPAIRRRPPGSRSSTGSSARPRPPTSEARQRLHGRMTCACVGAEVTGSGPCRTRPLRPHSPDGSCERSCIPDGDDG